jgi:uncharacterized membrane protein
MPENNKKFDIASNSNQNVNKSVSQKKESLWFYLFSHHERNKLDRTIHLKIFNKDIYLCGRCTFRYSALLFSLLIMIFTGYTPSILYTFPILILLIIIFFPVVSAIAWIHQFITKKDNPKFVRYTTGSMIGISEAVGISCIFFLDIFLILIYVFTYLAIMGIVGVFIMKKGKSSS